MGSVMTLQQALRDANLVLERSRETRRRLACVLPAPARLHLCGISRRHVERYRQAMLRAADMLTPDCADLSRVS